MRFTTTLLRVSLIGLICLLSAAHPGIVSAGTNVWTSNGPEGGSVNTLVIDPATPTTLYAGTLGRGVFKSTDAGETWEPVNSGLPGFGVSAFAIDPMTPSTVYVGIGSSGVFRSTNGGDDWVAASTGLPAYPVTVLVGGPTSPTTLFAGTWGGGVF